jgi:hypothetical protein
MFKSTGASTIGSVSLAMASSLAGPATGSEVPVCPTLMGSADLRLTGKHPARLTHRSSPHVASHGAQGLAPCEIKNSNKIKALLSLIGT